MWIKEPELWRLIFTPLAGGSVIFESVCGVWRTVAIKFWHLLNVWKWFGGTWRNDTTQFMSSVKELALMLWHLQLILNWTGWTCSIELNLFKLSINWRHHNIKASSLTLDMNWVVSFLQVPPNDFHTFNRCQNLIATVLHTPQTLSKITEPPAKGVNISLHSSGSLIHKCQNYFPLYISPSSGLFFISPDEDLLFEVETSWVNFLVSFNTDDQSKTDVANTINVITYKSKPSRWTFSIDFYLYKMLIKTF